MGMLRNTLIKHPGLRAQMEFLAAQHGIDIEFVTHASPQEVKVVRPPKHVVVLSFGNDSSTRGFSALYDKERLTYVGPWSGYGSYCPGCTSGIPITVPAAAGGTKTVGLRVGNVIYLYFSLEQLFEHGTSLAWQPEDAGGYGLEYVDGLGYGRWVTGGDSVALVRKLFNDIFDKHMPEAAKAVLEFNWDIERADFVTRQARFFATVFEKWSSRLSQVEQEKWNAGEHLRTLCREEAHLRASCEGWEAAAPARKKQAEDAFDTYISYVKNGVISDAQWAGSTFSFVVNPLNVGGDHEYATEMGPWRVSLDFNTCACSISKMDHTVLSSSGFWHPHINLSGRLCMGNADALLHEAVGRSDLVGAIAVILEFLQGYNEDSPYCRIEQWNPDYSDDDDHESCYENSSPHDCVCCYRDCGYRDDAESRCWDYHEDTPKDCIRCRDCDYVDTAEENCHRDQVNCGYAWKCVGECELSRCAYYQDSDSCYDSHEGAECTDCCVGSDCRRYVDSEAAEEPEEAPVEQAAEQMTPVGEAVPETVEETA